MTPQEVLIKAAELLESTTSAWTQRRLARSANGWPEAPNHPSACSWCALGAIAKVQELSDAPQLYNPASKLLAKHLNVANIANWNDAPERTREDVIDGLRSAALQTVTL